MTITLQDFAAGDTNYVAKLNSNSDVLETAIAALQAATSGAAFSAITLSTAYAALFGATVAVIGDDSYVCTNAGSDNLNVTSGYCYRPSLNSVLSKSTSTTLNFTGQSAATYYIVIDSTGAPTSGVVSTEAIYSVVWTGSAFGAITRLAAVVWGAADWIASQTSTALAATYTSLDDRLEAIEAAASIGAVARPSNYVYAGPAGGSPTNGIPTFRPLVAADVAGLGLGAGTVTSVALSLPSDLLTVSGSPVTTSGTLTAAKANVDSNMVYAGPTAGSPTVGAPGFRALVTADLPATVGYINIPQNSQSAAYTTVLADQGKHLLHPSADTTARTFTIDSNANVAYPIGTALTFVNQASAGVMTIAITTDTMRLAGAGTTGSRTLAANGIATALKVTATEWIISGTGLT